ncbi:bcl10-interacting CARD protein-like isoform X2 [Poecilia latipinna]|uniref:bcl10-interacting CARD protein-like isoform X2 n=1 Tax=Poecilia latipinna TaxID=48699 RepID=UPI00072EBDDD|nr:PREDICTED: bcl10-interacting CARD protein-like isoform X2 [Poecilia latipinna]XP_016531961.1 PREDICTED: caspase recruitment domain-containing protein 19 isoform X2 [Poecilia formosa]
MKSSSRVTPSFCALTRGWTLNWLTVWCCNSTGSTPRYSVTRKPARSLRVPTTERLRELLQHLREKGDDACYEFYRALHIQAEDVYFSLPTRIREREMTESRSAINVAVIPERCVLNDRGPIFFLSCFSVAVGIAFLYYYGEGQRLRCTEAFLHCSAVRLGKDAKDVFISYVEVGK